MSYELRAHLYTGIVGNPEINKIQEIYSWGEEILALHVILDGWTDRLQSCNNGVTKSKYPQLEFWYKLS